MAAMQDKYILRGSRTWKIMTLFGYGLTDAEIAKRFRTKPYVIAVYRKAYDGTLEDARGTGLYDTERWV